MNKTKKINVTLLADYRPELNRAKIRSQYKGRFQELFFSIFDFKRTLSGEERFVILKQLWEYGSFSVTRSPSPLKAFEEEMDLTFTKYAVDDYDYNLQPLHFHNAPLKASRAVSMKRHEVGKDGVIVYLNDLARARPGHGAMKTAQRYIDQIVNAKMTIATNLLLHKMPFFVPCDEDATDAYKEAMRQIFSDVPAVFVPASMNGREPKALNTNVPFIIDKLEAYCVRLENMFLDEIGMDNAKPVQTGQDRLLADEVNANNGVINCFRFGIKDSLREGFDDVETLFGRKIEFELRAPQSVSVHEETKQTQPGDEEEPGEEENQK